MAAQSCKRHEETDGDRKKQAARAHNKYSEASKMKKLEATLTGIYLLLLFLDLFTTWYGLNVGAVEKNPFINAISGIPWLLLLLKIAQAAVSLILLAYAYIELEPDYPKLFEIFMAGLILYMGFIVVQNTAIILELMK